MEQYIKIKINLSRSKLTLKQLNKLYRVDEYDPQDITLGSDIEVAFYKKPSEISEIGKYI
ncbi:hypothetical protein [Clostridium butyricum]